MPAIPDRHEAGREAATARRVPANFKTKIDTLVSRATGLVKKGVPEDQLMAQLKTDDLGWRLNFTGDRLDCFYAELSRSK